MFRLSALLSFGVVLIASSNATIVPASLAFDDFVKQDIAAEVFSPTTNAGELKPISALDDAPVDLETVSKMSAQSPFPEESMEPEGSEEPVVTMAMKRRSQGLMEAAEVMVATGEPELDSMVQMVGNAMESPEEMEASAEPEMMNMMVRMEELPMASTEPLMVSPDPLMASPEEAEPSIEPLELLEPRIFI